jgi:hypothetical protein
VLYQRQNLTMRMSMRQFTRLITPSPRGSSTMQRLHRHFMHYNFCRPHITLKGRTPAQAAGLTSRRWTIWDLIRLLDEAQSSKS